MKKLYSIFLVLMVFALYSCENNEDFSETGYIQLALDKDISVITKANINISDEPLSVEVKNAAGNVVKKYDNFYSEAASSRIALPSGSYTVQAYSNKNLEKSGFEQAYYASPVTQVTVKAGEVQTLKLVCTLANIKVSVEYTEAIRKYFKKYQATVSNDYGSILFTETEKRAAYFAPEPLSVRLDLTNNTDQQFFVKKEISDTKPREYYKLRFDVEPATDEEAGADFNIVIEAMDADTTFVLKVPVADSSYGKEKPVFEEGEWPSFEEGKGTTIKQKIFSEVGLKSVILELPEDILLLTGVSSPSIDLSTASELDLLKLKITLSKPVLESKELELDFTALSKVLVSKSFDTTYPVTLIAKDTLNQVTKVEKNFHIKPNGIYALEANAYAHFAYLLGGDFLETPSTSFGFKYCVKGTANFVTVTEGIVKNEDQTFGVRIDGLTPGTTYEYIAYTDQGEDKDEFTTEMERQMPNTNFDSWFMKGQIVYPNIDLTEGNYWWDSANPGSGAMGLLPTKEEKSIVISGSAARLATGSVIGVMAAGNIYTGKFGAVAGLGASIEFGRPFECRPSIMEGYYKYEPGPIDMFKAPYEDKKDETDKCSIYILLADWDRPFTVNTNTGTFIDYKNDPAIIAYGELPDGSAATGSEKNGYKKFSIPLEYRSDRKPKYIVVVAASSKLGDYFTGSTKSVLYLDEFSLKYDDTIVIPNK